MFISAISAVVCSAVTDTFDGFEGDFLALGGESNLEVSKASKVSIDIDSDDPDSDRPNCCVCDVSDGEPLPLPLSLLVLLNLERELFSGLFLVFI